MNQTTKRIGISIIVAMLTATSPARADSTKREAPVPTPPAPQIKFCSILADTYNKYHKLWWQESDADRNHNILAREQIQAQMDAVSLAGAGDIFKLLKPSKFAFTDWVVDVKEIIPVEDEIHLTFTSCPELQLMMILELHGKLKKKEARLPLLASAKLDDQFNVTGVFISVFDKPPTEKDIAFDWIWPKFYTRIVTVK
jgi:hypothetical protein